MGLTLIASLATVTLLVFGCASPVGRNASSPSADTTERVSVASR